MKHQAARAPLTIILTTALLISLAPALAATPAAQTQQSTNVNRTKRGKNGEPLAKGSEAADKSNPDQNNPTEPAETNPASATKTTQAPLPDPASAPKATQAPPPDPDAGKSADTSTVRKAQDWGSGSSSGGSGSRPTAPPFDRPMGHERSAQRASADQRQAPTREPANQDQTTNSQPSRSGSDRVTDRSNGSYPDSGSTSTSSRRPPVLHRSDDTRATNDNRDSDQNRSMRTNPPVLHRPGEDQNTDADPNRSSTNEKVTPRTQRSGDDDVIKLESTLVDIPLLVSDRSGRYVPQLSARDFELYEDGVRQKIASFGSEEVPFNVALLLDVSPSVQGNEQDIQDAALAFVRQLRNQDRVMVVSFDRSIHYLCDFTNDRRQLEWAIRQARTGQGTSVYDAVYEVVTRKLRGIDGRKALILFSDGEDTTSSRVGYDETIDAVSESDVLVYGLRYPGSGGGGGHVRVDPWPRSVPRLPIPLPWPTPGRRRWPFPFFRFGDSSSYTGGAPAPQSRRRRGGGGGDFMADVTAAGGGPVYDAERVSDLSRLASQIAEELRHVYVLSYYPSNPLSNGGYRSVRVSIPGRSDIAVRHRKGYNARPSGNSKPTI